MKATMRIIPAFENYIFDWDYETYLSIGSYGSGKSYSTAQKIILKLLEQKRKAAVFREVYNTHFDSTFDLLKEVLSALGILAEEGVRKSSNKVCWGISPLRFRFPNGSKIIFKGMDDTEKIKSLNGVSIVWFEECSEINYPAFLELLGRIRTPNVSMHFLLTCNPVGMSNWVYQHFFCKTMKDGTEKLIVDAEKFYDKKTLVKGRTYYHHSTVDDNSFAPREYVIRLDEMKLYDKALWLVARLGRFGVAGLRVLPQFEVMNKDLVLHAVAAIPDKFHRIGMDFGFETSFNAVIRMAVDDEKKWLYIYKEYYKNHMTDDKTAIDLIEWDEHIKEDVIRADCAEPKSIRYYKQEGFLMRACRKLADKKTEGSRIANTKKCKRFKRIICSKECVNVIRELKDLTYKKKKDGTISYGEFNIDPHTFSAIWYGLDDYTVANVKQKINNSVKGR